LDPDSYPEFFFKFPDLSEVKFDSPLHHAVKSQISPLNFAAGVKSRRCTVQRGAKSMIFAEIFPLHDATGSKFGSGDLSLKTSGDSLGPEKGTIM
jgi:hypothetical protein